LIFCGFSDELWMAAVEVLLYISSGAEDGSMVSLKLDTKGQDLEDGFQTKTPATSIVQ
jgi:hypothetical protein